MLFYRILIPLFLVSFPAASAKQAPVDFVPATQGSPEQTGITNEDVDNGHIVDRVYSSISLEARFFFPRTSTDNHENLQQVPKDLNSLVKLIHQTTTLFAGTLAIKNKQTGERIADAFYPAGGIFCSCVPSSLKIEANGKSLQFANAISTLIRISSISHRQEGIL